MEGAGQEEGGVEVLQEPGQVEGEQEGNASVLLDWPWPLGSVVVEGWALNRGPPY